MLAQICPVDASRGRRAEYASDASNYRVVPELVAFPRTEAEVLSLHEVALERGVSLTGRGAGTSVAGNAIGTGLVIDYSRFFNQIIDIDPGAKLARVQPGVVLSHLQEVAVPFGLWFGPDPSTKNRATLGGMIGNNACGPHALAYGRTADNVESLEVIDGTARRYRAEKVTDVPGLAQLVDANLAPLRTELGRFRRQVSGYSLEHLLPENGASLAKALVGTEGTCVTAVEATVNLVDVPTHPLLVVLGYADMPAAADAVVGLTSLGLLAIEGIDSRLVEVVRRHRSTVPELPEGAGWLLCEAPDQETAKRAVREAQAMDARIVTNSAEAAALWRIRADGVGLAGRTPAGNQAWPGWEDAAVPPVHLGDYLRDFDALMDRYQVQGLPYGHFGDGCVHVRIDWPLETTPDTQLFQTFLSEAAELVAAYGGSLSGEHGDGRARSALLERMYSPAVLNLFGQFKGLFDPEGIMNPGVVVDPPPVSTDLRRPQARPVAASGFALREDAGSFTNAVHRCVGVGKCRANNAPAGGFMCPSYQATGDENDVTRGRARVLQELTNKKSLLGGWDDPGVTEALDLCLSCKACGRDCPAGVDMARYKSEAIFQRYRGKIRPINHYVLGWLPRWARLVSAFPPLAFVSNWAMSRPMIRRGVFAAVGIDSRRRMTAFATQRFSRWFRKQQEPSESSADKGSAAQGTGKRGDVIVWADSFSEYLDPAAATAMVQVLQKAGYRVRIPSAPACCGLTWISTGQLDGAKSRLSGLLNVLGPAAQAGVPIVGVEPSCTAVLRDDLLDLLPEDPRTQAVSRHVFTLAELLTDAKLGPNWDQGESWAPDLSGLQVIAQPHCHQHAVMGFEADRDLLVRLGAEVTELAGCCGLAGNFGMEKGHYDTSVAVARNSLLPALEDASPGTVFLADGYSCRTQAQQLAQVKGISLAQLLAG